MPNTIEYIIYGIIAIAGSLEPNEFLFDLIDFVYKFVSVYLDAAWHMITLGYFLGALSIRIKEEMDDTGKQRVDAIRKRVMYEAAVFFLLLAIIQTLVRR